MKIKLMTDASSLPAMAAVGIELRKPPFMGTRGRILRWDVYSYITRGQGYFTDRRRARIKIQAGDVIYQRAGEWHCFDPDPGTTWDEYWLLFDRLKVEAYFGQLLPPQPGARSIGLQLPLLDTWRELYEMWLFRPRGFKLYAHYLAHKILMEVNQQFQPLLFRGSGSWLARACHYMRQHLRAPALNAAEAAGAAGQSYESFRKQFREKTGYAPKQFFLRLKMHRAEELLLRTSLTIKEVAERVGLADPYYFSRLFHAKTGLAPRAYRRRFFSAAARPRRSGLRKISRPLPGAAAPEPAGEVKHPAASRGASLRNPAKPRTPFLPVASHRASWRRRVKI